ncbi:MAG: hypothetical protein WCI67_08940 [Chloroflexales bacterium]
MFTRSSRYRTQPEVLATDAADRTMRSVEPRPLPPTPGALLHTLAEGERLDTIANAYYRQPLRWWRICDANPDFMSPLALLGQEPIITARFALAPAPLCALAPELRHDLDTHAHISAPLWRALRQARLRPSPRAQILPERPGKQWRIVGPLRNAYVVVDVAGELIVYPAQPPWDDLQRRLAALVGVEAVAVQEEIDPTLAQLQSLGQALPAGMDRYDRAVSVTFNNRSLPIKDVIRAINATPGITAGEPTLIGRAGKQIAIPPAW